MVQAIEPRVPTPIKIQTAARSSWTTSPGDLANAKRKSPKRTTTMNPTVVNAHQEPHLFDREMAVLEDQSFRAATVTGLPGV